MRFRDKHKLTYSSWMEMRRRCNKSNRWLYNKYGGRGIRVCKRWQNSFTNFLDDMGERPKGTTLERISSNKHYTPKNCKWATRTEQNNNRPNYNRFISIDGKRMTIAQWSKATGIKYVTIWARLKRGITGKQALEMV